MNQEIESLDKNKSKNCRYKCNKNRNFKRDVSSKSKKIIRITNKCSKGINKYEQNQLAVGLRAFIQVITLEKYSRRKLTNGKFINQGVIKKPEEEYRKRTSD